MQPAQAYPHAESGHERSNGAVWNDSNACRRRQSQAFHTTRNKKHQLPENLRMAATLMKLGRVLPQKQRAKASSPQVLKSIAYFAYCNSLAYRSLTLTFYTLLQRRGLRPAPREAAGRENRRRITEAFRSCFYFFVRGPCLLERILRPTLVAATNNRAYQSCRPTQHLFDAQRCRPACFSSGFPRLRYSRKQHI